MKKMYKKKSFLNVKAMLVMALVCFMAMPTFAADWKGKLKNGITYTLTTTSGNSFKVTCPGDSDFHNKTYDAIGNNLYCNDSNEATIVFNNTSPILINDRIIAYDNAKLHLVKGILSDQPTLKRGTRNGQIIYLSGNPTLYIKGYGNNTSDMSSRFIIDGGAEYSTPYDGRTAVTSQGAGGRMIYCTGTGGGSLQVENAIFQNVYNHGGDTGFIEYYNSTNVFTESNFKDVLFRGSHAKTGTVIHWRANSFHNTTMENVEIWGCDNTNYVNGVETQDTGGALRTRGGTHASLTLINCKIHDCESPVGGAIVWLAMGEADNKLTIKDCDFYNNRAHGCPGNRPGMGGAIYTSARMDLQTGNKFYGNWAERGGAICVLNYDGGSSPFNGGGFTVTVQEGVRIYNNTASEYGGGVFCYLRCSPDCGFDPQGNPVEVHNQFTMLGGEICANQAPMGAGVAIYDYAAKRILARPTLSSGETPQWSGEYHTTVKINGGKICNNICTNTESGTKGGGLFIGKILNQHLIDGTNNTFPSNDEGCLFTYADAGGAGTLEVIATEGLVVANESRNSSENGEGGGMYICNETADLSSYFHTHDYDGICNVTIDGNVEFYANQSDSRGGGVKIDGGNLLVRGGKIGCETFDYSYDIRENGEWVTQNLTGVNGANIVNAGDGGGFAVAGGDLNFARGSVKYNQAKGTGAYKGEGGGFHITGGIVKVHGGTIEYNDAETRGGGFFVDVADATTETYISSDTTTTLIQNNHAKINGGGAFVNNGFLKIVGAPTRFVNNNASVSATSGDCRGGGIYMSQGSALIQDASFEGNWSTLEGGALYVQGSVTVQGNSSFIKNYTKNKGGAIFVNGGSNTANFVLRGGVIGGSEADRNYTTGTNNNANGGGVYITGANASTLLEGGEVSYNKSIQGGGLYISTAADNVSQFTQTAKLNYNEANIGGGAYINQGQLSINGSAIEINNNKASSHGGGIYIQNGQITIEGSSASGTTTINENVSTNGYGGGINSQNGAVILKGLGSISLNKNHCNLGGGAIYTRTGNITLEGDCSKQINENYTNRNGGGALYVYQGSVSIKGSGATEINDNYAELQGASGGAVYIGSGSVTMEGTGSKTLNRNRATRGSGGAIYANTGSVSLTGTGDININNNYAFQEGGAIFTNATTSSITIGEQGVSTNMLMSENQAGNQGGAMRVGGTATLWTGNITKNFCQFQGGAIYMAGGVFTMNGGVVGGTTTDGNYTTATDNGIYGGGGLYVSGGTVNLNGGSVSGNHVGAGTNGGGIYMGFDESNNTSGTCTVAGGTVGGADATYANSAELGGGIFSAGGTINVTSSAKAVGSVKYNSANKGGGIYSNGDDAVVNVTNGNVEWNHATTLGGGIYAQRGWVNFSDGFIRYNKAEELGGGLYVDTEGNMTLKGNANLTRNYVPKGQKGGGIYLLGVIVVGEKESKTLGIIKAEDNFAADTDDPSTYTPPINPNTGDPNWRKVRNNVYLPDPVAYAYNSGDRHVDVITVIEDGLNEASRVGFSVPHNFIPVVFCERSNETGASGYPTNQDYVDRFSTGQAWDVVIFEDRSYYRAVHEYTSAIYDPDHLYLLEFWPEGVAQLVEDDPNPNNTFDQLDDPIIITTDQDMAHFACWVNGSQLFDYVPHPDANAIMEGDVNMDLFSWVPIGPYSGNFDGQGHTITGISSQLYQEHMGYGLFGTVNGGTVENVLLKDAFYQIDNKEGIVIGAIVSEAVGGTEVANCEASAYIGSNHNETIIGGAVGRTGQVANQTIYDNIDHPAVSHSVPVAGANTNEQVKTEFIIPADMLAGMTDATITGLSFRLSDVATAGWGSAQFQVFIKEVTDDQISSFQGTSGATVVYEGPLDPSHISMPVTFSTAYGPYHGGNLLVGIYCTTPGTSLNDASFYGKEVTGACVQGTGNNAQQQNFLPWMTFTCGQTQAEETPDVHSVYACVEMQGGLMGGLVGHIVNGNLENSFANPKFDYTGTTQYFGGLVGVNGGTVENCYTRMQGATATTDGDAPTSERFGWFVGQNNTDGVVNYCYNREQTTNYIKSNLGKMNGSGYYANNTEVPYLYKRRDNQVTVDLTEGLNTSTNNEFVPADDKDHQMLLCLNNWVEAKNGGEGEHPEYTKWMRTTSKTINNDLPVLKMPFANTIVGTTSTVYLDYGDINDMMSTYQAVNQALCLYQSKDGMDSNEGSGAKLYINEDVSVIPADRENGVINAYVGVTIANVAGADGAQPTFGGTDAIDWHMFSTPLQAAPLGIDYHGDVTQYHGSMNGYDYYGHYGPYYRFMEGDADGNIGYFPSHTYGEEYPASDATVVSGNYYPEWDFYTYYEPEYHWINFKRNSMDHWHENLHTAQIHYFGDGVTEGNETNLVQGRGYLVAFADDATYLQSHGDLNTGGDIALPVTMEGYYSTGYNLLGNPYQACLDFNAFAEYNSSDEDDEAIWTSVEEASYRILSETAKDYVTFAYGSSENPFGAGRYIHPHQGFMVYSNTNESAIAYFTDLDGADGPHMRAIEDATPYRGGQVNYPLVNLFATEGNGNETMVTVELGRPDKGGAKLMSDLKVGKGQMWCHYDDADWKLAYTRPGISELPIRFTTIEDTEYTMTWSTHNGDFSYLHLIDNLTGADVDCLSESEYKFSSKTSDYQSRFKLVFGYTGVEENDEPEVQETEFAFMMGDELVVNGEGTLELFDVNGRQLMSTMTQGTQTTVHLPQVSTGVYVLRMTSDGQVKTQKMVINQ